MSLLLALLCLSAHADDGADIVRMIQSANQQCTRASTSCAPSREPLTAPKPLEVERGVLNDNHGGKVAISTIDEADLKRLRALYPPNLRPFDPEVCSQRAHIIGDTLARAGIETPKLLLYPGGWPGFRGSIIPDDRARASDGRTPHWDYHVVNLINVRHASGAVETYVIDPFMEGLPVPRAAWEKRLHTNPHSSIGRELVMSRFNYGPLGSWTSDEHEEKTEYDPDLLTRAYAIMRGEPKR